MPYCNVCGEWTSKGKITCPDCQALIKEIDEQKEKTKEENQK